MSVGRRGVSINKEKPSAQSYGLIGGGGKRDPAILLDLDYWVALPA